MSDPWENLLEAARSVHLDNSKLQDFCPFPKDIKKTSSIIDNSLIVEMYPQEETYNKLKKQIQSMKNLIYFRFWES